MRLIDADAVLQALSIFNSNKYADKHYIYGIRTAKDIIKNAPTVDKWVSVKDKLPDEGKYVLVWESQGFAYCDKLVCGIWNIGANNSAIITHWMPLPEGPKEESKE